MDELMDTNEKDDRVDSNEQDDPINIDQSIHDVIANLGPEEQMELRNIDSSYNSYSWMNNGNSGDDHGMMGLDSLNEINASAGGGYRSPSQHSPTNQGYGNRSNNNYFFDESNMNMSLGDVGRINRIAHAEVAIRQEMFKECTFRPQIKNLPNSYGAMKDSGTHFLTRVNKWNKERDADIKKKSDALLKSEMSACTFTPKLSKTSERTIREMRGNCREDFSDRLYKSSSLYTEQRYKLIEHERAKEESLEKIQCTFQPELATKKFNESNTVNSKLYQSKDNIMPPPPGQSDGRKYSFTPQVNKIKPHMSSAKAYCKTNVIERLTKPISQQNLPNQAPPPPEQTLTFDGIYEDGRPIMDVNSFVRSGRRSVSPSHASPRPCSSLNTYNRVDPESTDGKKEMSAEEIKTRKFQFEQFVRRQKQLLETKNLSTKLLEQAVTPSFQPKFCKKSMDIAQPADFQQRLERDLQKRFANEEGQSKAAIAMTMEETFAPKINTKSEKLRSRSAYEMSRGDQYRKEASMRLTKLQQEQEELDEITFKPQIFTHNYQKSASGQNHSKPSLATDPATYLNRHRDMQMEKENMRIQELKKREEEETKECSFTPQTIDCPEYVKRIAKSMAIVRAAKGAQVIGSNKPEWR